MFALLNNYFFLKAFFNKSRQKYKSGHQKPHSHIPFKCPKIYKYFPKKCEGFYFLIPKFVHSGKKRITTHKYQQTFAGLYVACSHTYKKAVHKFIVLNHALIFKMLVSSLKMRATLCTYIYLYIYEQRGHFRLFMLMEYPSETMAITATVPRYYNCCLTICGR